MTAPDSAVTVGAMSAPVSTIRNLGPAVERECARAGITSAQDLRDLGAHEAYRRMIVAGTRPHFIGYYALVMGLQGRPWNDCQGAEKDALRAAFDTLKSQTSAPKDTGIERILDQIGTGLRR